MARKLRDYIVLYYNSNNTVSFILTPKFVTSLFVISLLLPDQGGPNLTIIYGVFAFGISLNSLPLPIIRSTFSVVIFKVFTEFIYTLYRIIYTLLLMFC
jgi:hypothetical protein